jgi:hypothetical protein
VDVWGYALRGETRPCEKRALWSPLLPVVASRERRLAVAPHLGLFALTTEFDSPCNRGG